MHLTELQTRLTSVSGRLDLDTPTLTDYINNGIKLLDELSGSINIPKWHFTKLNAGDRTVILPAHARNILDIWIHTDTDATQLTLTTLTAIRNAAVLAGCPAEYALIPVLVSDNTTIAMSEYYANLGEFTVDSSFTPNGLRLWPTPDREYILEVLGNFYSPALSVTQTDNYWAAQQPDLVISAAMYKIDVDCRNTMGAREALATISLELNELANDRIELELSNQNLILGG